MTNTIADALRAAIDLLSATRETFAAEVMLREYDDALDKLRAAQSATAAMTDEIERMRAALDALGVAIADAGYTWTPEMRSAYEKGEMSSSYGRLAAIRDYWTPRDEDARAEVRVTDLNEVLREIERLKKEVDAANAFHRVAIAERNYERFSNERVTRLLSEIYKLMSPPAFVLDGKRLTFNPPGGALSALQSLSDRIRALPDELDAIDYAMKEQKE